MKQTAAAGLEANWGEECRLGEQARKQTVGASQEADRASSLMEEAQKQAWESRLGSRL